MTVESDKYFKIITKANYRFNDNYGITFINPETFERMDNALSKLRKLKELDDYSYHKIRNIFRVYYNNYFN